MLVKIVATEETDAEVRSFQSEVFMIFCHLISKDVKHERIINSLFNSLENKPIPLYYCKSWIDGINWRLLQTIQSPLIPTNENSQVIGLIFFFEDINAVILPSYECFAMKTTTPKTWFFRCKVQQQSVCHSRTL